MFQSMERATVAGYELTIVVPPSYGQTGKRYPVLYVQDQGDVIMQSLNYIERLFRTNELDELIFVAIAPHDRRHDYTPWRAKGLLPNTPDFGGNGLAYLTDVAERIKPYVDRTYATLPEAEHTGIGGCSFGGLISLYALYYFPGVFGKLALISASFWYEDLVSDMSGRKIESDPRIYMYVGELEGVYKTNIQRDMVPLTKKAHALLLETGVKKEKLKFETDPEGTHDDLFFSPRMIEALRWLFGKGKQGGGSRNHSR